ncbi:hypothetical protein [Erwinia pyrifoliae]|uniref:hypothetical protein n=1 Tax=Erwinia pyrifoliae TaxID=79967 RepID=UPI00220202EE|nr:hypothetical protein [Erwinia pyrifoliae]UWS31029.1 hypothetical protein NYP81_06135 [Erwinia pyrifoliae]
MLPISGSSANHVQAPPVGDARFSHKDDTTPSPVMKKLSTVANSLGDDLKSLPSRICLSTSDKLELEREKEVLMMLKEPHNQELHHLGEHYETMVNRALSNARRDKEELGPQEHIDKAASDTIKRIPGGDVNCKFIKSKLDSRVERYCWLVE